MRLLAAAALALFAGCSSAPETPPLTLGDVLQMSKAEIAPGVIIERIRAGRIEAQDLTPSQIIGLHEEGVDPQVLSALVRASAGQKPPPYSPPSKTEEAEP